jgi:mannose-1-phosphate guanylyltransferase
MNKNAVMLVMPADHYVDDKRGEIKNLKRGIEFVIDNDEAIVVIGVRPECASSEYGYVKIVKSAAIAKAERFFEKPDIKTARRYYASGAYLWNSGIFIFKARTFMTSLQRYAPKIFSESAHENISKSYERMPDISIDYAVMEKADNIYCLKGSYGWSDIGSFQALERVLNRESRTFVKRGGKIVKIHPAPSK